MSDRYTSPELSRQLAEAGLIVDGGRDPRWWNQNPNLAGWCCDSWRYTYTPSGQGYKSFRALRLDDVLEGIETFSAPLRREWTINTCDMGYAAHVYGPGMNDCVPLFEEAHPESVVEAAGLVLLALLRERAKP